MGSRMEVGVGVCMGLGVCDSRGVYCPRYVGMGLVWVWVSRDPKEVWVWQKESWKLAGAPTNCPKPIDQ